MAPSFTNPLSHPFRMDSEKPPSLGHLLVRVAATLVALLLLYVLGVGPATYAEIRWTGSAPLFDKLYDPFFRATHRTPLELPVDAYVEWWMRLAGLKPYKESPRLHDIRSRAMRLSS